MSLLTEIPYKQRCLFKNQFRFQNQEQTIFLSRHYCSSDIYDRYYLKIGFFEQESFIVQGYIYFYLDIKIMQSKFIGLYVDDKYRNCGIASLLISNWIQLCLDEEIIDL